MILHHSLKYSISFVLLLLCFACSKKKISPPVPEAPKELRTGAEVLIDQYLDTLQGKKIAIVANPTSQFRNGTHLVDSLLSLGVEVVKVFGPEHGFRGNVGAGVKVESGVDEKTGLPAVSLYGSNKKPSAAQLEDVDLVLFDIQDVGSRHYTYIYTMTYVMEACAESGKDFMVLDRPNPNGWYVDGPILEDEYSSFIGMHEIPIVHGMTVGEYAKMVNEEGWMENEVRANLAVIPCEHYRHEMRWSETKLPWVAPSPNLATEYAAYLYPAITWFEPTPVSVGRGTHDAFTIVGADWFTGIKDNMDSSGTARLYGMGLIPYSFTPVSLPGKSKYPKFQDQEIQGLQFEGRVGGDDLFKAGISLVKTFYLQHKAAGTEGKFFGKSFGRWPGNASFKQQIEAGNSPEEIYASWQEELQKFKEKRAKYLLYE